MQWSTEVKIDNVTKPAVEHLQDLIDAGTPYEACAELLGVTSRAVGNKAHQLKSGPGKSKPKPALETYVDEATQETVIRARLESIHSPEELMAAVGLDPDNWIVTRYHTGSWDVPAPDESKNLVAEDGKWSGTVTKKSGIKTMFKYELTVIPRNPETQVVHLQPIAAAVQYPPITGQHLHATQTVSYLIGADPQFGYSGNRPYHDRRAMDLLCQVAAIEQPHHIVLLGDMFDLAQWQDRFLNEPATMNLTQGALAEAHYWLHVLRQSCPMSTITIIEGNHDMRMRTSVVKHLATAYGLRRIGDDTLPVLSIPYLLNTEALQVRYIPGWPKNQLWIDDFLVFEHGDRYSQTPGGTVASILKDATGCTVAGHAHRLELAYKTKHGPSGSYDIFAFLPGCMCHTDGRVPSKGGRPQWQQGIAMVYAEPNTPNVQVAPMHIHDGTCMFANKTMVSNLDPHLGAMHQMFPSIP